MCSAKVGPAIRRNTIRQQRRFHSHQLFVASDSFRNQTMIPWITWPCTSVSPRSMPPKDKDSVATYNGCERTRKGGRRHLVALCITRRPPPPRLRSNMSSVHHEVLTFGAWSTTPLARKIQRQLAEVGQSSASYDRRQVAEVSARTRHRCELARTAICSGRCNRRELTWLRIAGGGGVLSVLRTMDQT
jgi:hypothetical protein